MAKVGFAEEKNPTVYVPEDAPVEAAAYSTITLTGPDDALAITSLSKNDLPAKEAIACIRNYIKSKCDPKTTLIWTRGSLDQMVIDSLCKVTGDEPIMQYANYRDMRTYVDLVATEPVRGYCSINAESYPGVWDRNVVIKHNPIDDVVLDALMLLYPY